MPEITIKFSPTGISALAGLYRTQEGDGPLTDRQKARRYLIQHCREVEARRRKQVAQKTIEIDETSAI